MGSDPPGTIECDVCIVGAGPAGLSLAQALDQSGATTVIVERGNWANTAQQPQPMATSGDPSLGDLSTSRACAIGGTASIWNTIRAGEAGAKYVALDPIDFETRTVTPHSGWPIDAAKLTPWYLEAERTVGLREWPHPDQEIFPFPLDGLVSNRYRWAPATIFTQQIPARLRSSERTTVLDSATVTRLVPTPDGSSIAAAEWRIPSGECGRIIARNYVIATGTIENCRMLMVLNRERRCTIPDWLGRGFMEHPIDRSLTLVTRHPAASPLAGFYDFRGIQIGRIGLSRELMQRQALRNASLRLFVVRYRRSVQAFRRLSNLAGRTPRTEYRVLLDLEQAPHPDNLLVLTDQNDSLGVPRLRLHWEWRSDDEAFRQRLLPILAEEFRRSGSGEISIGPIAPLETDVHHHAGTTRMHHDPAAGVVDANLRVHGVSNLYVVGASVFPTSGIANPTLTIVALSLRLAAQLSDP